MGKRSVSWIVSVVSLLALLSFCGGGGGGGSPSVSSTGSGQSPSTPAVVGKIQKGPFIQGSQVVIQELDARLVPTGKVYYTQTVDDFGSFTLNAAVSSPYVDVRTTGFYFNEVTGVLSNAAITLEAIGDTSAGGVVNVNILTTLEYNRVKYLLRNGCSFSQARAQAKREILQVFGINAAQIGVNIVDFTSMNMQNDSVSDSVLIAVSAILQSDGTEASLSELASKISADMEEDGTLDAATIATRFSQNASKLDLASIRSNLQARYSALGLSLSVPPFEEYVDTDWDGIIPLFETKQPNASPGAGTHTDDIEVTLTSATDGAIIYYTTNGSTPDASSAVYTQPIAIAGDGTAMTIKAFAKKQGLRDSSIMTAVYTINYPKVRNPVFASPSDTYSSDILLALSSATENATIYYTTDGTPPTLASNAYSQSIPIAGDGSWVRVRAKAVAPKHKDSDVVEAYYKIDYAYNPSVYITTLTVNDYLSHIVGTWVGNVTSPWEAYKSVEVTFSANGAYSARSLSTAANNNYDAWIPAFYYGTDDDSASKTYTIFDLYGNGKAEGTIGIYFGPGNTSTGSLRYITLLNSYDNLKFEFWHIVGSGQYGPVTFTLTRKP